MPKLRIFFFSVLLLAAAIPCRAQYDVDTIPSTIPSVVVDTSDVVVDTTSIVDDVVDSVGVIDSLSIFRQQLDEVTRQLDSTLFMQAMLRQQLIELAKLKDSLIVVNDIIQQELQEKNRLMSDQVRALQEKEQLVAEKEELYRQAMSASTLDKTRLEGELKLKEANIEAKAREIAYLQKDIDAKDITLKSQSENYTSLLAEKERYRILVDSLQKRVTAYEVDAIRKQEENKYLQQRVKDAEEKAAISLNKKKKVRPIQGIAMRFFRTPDWDIRLANVDGNVVGVIRNKNAGDIEFDFVTGASVMLWDLTDYFNNKPTKDTAGNRLPEIPRFDQKFNYDLGIYVGFGGTNLFKNFYLGPSFRFVDFFYLTIGVNICEYEILTGGKTEGSILGPNESLDKFTAKSWLVKPFIALSIDLDFLSYIKK